MAILSVRKYGDPGLRRRARPVDEVTPEVRTMIVNMTDTMYDDVGIGLAAPQVGISLRLIVPADEDGRDVQALLNPALIEQAGEDTGTRPRSSDRAARARARRRMARASARARR